MFSVEIKILDFGRRRVCASWELVVFPRSWASDPISGREQWRQGVGMWVRAIAYSNRGVIQASRRAIISGCDVAKVEQRSWEVSFGKGRGNGKANGMGRVGPSGSGT